MKIIRMPIRKYGIRYFRLFFQFLRSFDLKGPNIIFFQIQCAQATIIPDYGTIFKTLLRLFPLVEFYMADRQVIIATAVPKAFSSPHRGLAQFGGAVFRDCEGLDDGLCRNGLLHVSSYT